MQEGPGEVGAIEHCFEKVRTLQIGTRQVGLAEIRSSEIGTLKIRVGKIEPAQIEPAANRPETSPASRFAPPARRSMPQRLF